MSKEQTPIEELQELMNVHLSNRGFSKEYLLNNRGLIGAVIEEMESRVNAKVLEALERHIVGFVIHSANEDLSEDDKGYNEFVNLVKNYIETEVKPKYER